MSKHLVCDTCGADVPPEGAYSNYPPEGWYTLTLRCNTTTPDRERHFCCPVCVIEGMKRDIKTGSEALIGKTTADYTAYLVDPGHDPRD